MGKRHEESLRTADLEAAKNRFHRRMQEIEAGASPNDRADQTLQQAAAEWVTNRQRQISKGSFLTERSIVRNLVAVFGANAPLDEQVFQQICAEHAAVHGRELRC